jgi:hypothetical protein
MSLNHYLLRKENEMKKLCFYILIFSFLNYVGCYAWRKVDKEILYTEDLGEPAGVVTIIMNDEERIVVDDGIYEVVGDTLYIKRVKQDTDRVEQINVKISLDNIQSVWIEKPDGFATAGCVISLAALAFIIVGVIAVANNDYSTNSCQSGDFSN